MNAKLPFQIRRKQFIGIFTFGIVILLSSIFKTIIPQKNISDYDRKWAWTKVEDNKPTVLLAEFDPNELDEKQWEKLGFSNRQVATILKYKNIVGGKFSNKGQLKKCYAISEEKYAEIESYILLPEKNSTFNKSDFIKKELLIPSRFNPDKYTAKDWLKMGFSEKQSSAIDKYKQFLGGSFVSKEKFKECFIISDENFKKLTPHLILPEKTPENYQKTWAKKENTKSKIKLSPFNPNVLDEKGWKDLGFTEKQAQVIVNYKNRNLKGNFKNLEDIKNCFVISEEKFQELSPYIHLAIPNNDVVHNNSINTAIPQEKSTDFSKIDLNKITYKQLVEFGFIEKDAAMILGFRKKLGGFMVSQQLVDTYEIDKALAEKLIATAILNTENVQKYSLAEAPEEWLKSHPYFKYSAEKIIFFRISTPEDKKILKFLKLKPEYETRMKLYIKD
jgi:DNA uptake protein ComE-like DNA-binding protein